MLEKRFQISTLISSRYFLIWVVLVDKITVNYMGQWSDRPLLLAACLWKFVRKAESEASRLCTFWEELLMNPECYPFKIDIAGDICEVCRVLLQTIAYVPSILGDRIESVSAFSLCNMKISEVEANGKIEEGLKNRENIQQRVK